jgi:hypothetical protein
MSKGADFLKQVVLSDADGNRARIINVRGGESGLDYLEITTQSKQERIDKIATRHRIYSEEIRLEDIVYPAKPDNSEQQA